MSIKLVESSINVILLTLFPNFPQSQLLFTIVRTTRLATSLLHLLQSERSTTNSEQDDTHLTFGLDLPSV